MNRWREPRSAVERQPPGFEYGTARPMGRVEIWWNAAFCFAVYTRIPGRTEREDVWWSVPRYRDLTSLVRGIYAATGTTGVAWNYDILRTVSSWADAPSTHLGQVGSAETNRTFDLEWVDVSHLSGQGPELRRDDTNATSQSEKGRP